MKILNLKEAKKIIKQGGVIIIPTDTAYGVTCDALNAKAVNRVVNIKGRPENKSFPINIYSINLLKDWVDKLSSEQKSVLRKFWPGDLSMVFETDRDIEFITRRENNRFTISIRMPDHTVPLGLSKAVNGPIVGTSANFTGGIDAYTLHELNPDFIRLTDGVVEGICGAKPVSTVMEIRNREIIIYRQGYITKDMILKTMSS